MSLPIINFRRLLRFMPKWVKRKVTEHHLRRLNEIQSMLIPSKMISYDVYLKALYDFGLSVDTRLYKDFNYFNRVEVKVYTTSSQKAADALYDLLHYKNVYLLNQPNEQTHPTVLRFIDYYSNTESVEQIMELSPALVYYAWLLRRKDTTAKEEASRREELNRLREEHVDLLRGRLTAKLINDYVELLLVSLTGILEELRA